MKLGLLLKGLSIYKQGLPLSLALHSLVVTSTFMYCSYPVTSLHNKDPFTIKMIFIKKEKSSIQEFKYPSSLKLTPISTLDSQDSHFSSCNKKMPSPQKKVMKNAAFHLPPIAKKDIAKDISGSCEKSPLHNLNSQKYSPASFQGRHLKNPKPHYPRRARELGFEGVVVLHVKVSKVGKATGIDILSSSGYTLLDKAALDTLHQWSFIPAQIGCHLTESNLKIRIRFSLTDANSTDVVAS
jgi:TonB family protein